MKKLFDEYVLDLYRLQAIHSEQAAESAESNKRVLLLKMDRDRKGLTVSEQKIADGLQMDFLELFNSRRTIEKFGFNSIQEELDYYSKHDAGAVKSVVDLMNDRHDYLSALDRIREVKNFIPPKTYWALKAICWFRMGQREIANQFFSEYVRLDGDVAIIRMICL